ncbi:hypothetical protein Misp01_49160 [Microtetraspora sp. NBRC 13810]|nr:hypothetical protein Misp01_49160 [Microtetraspora sp. NBRC 13810]
MRDWADEARVPPDLAARALRRRRWRRTRGAVLAGAIAILVISVLPRYVVPPLLGKDPGRAATVTTEESGEPTQQPSRPPALAEPITDPESSPPKKLIAAGDVAVYAYNVWDYVKISDERQVSRLTWYLYDDGTRTYEKTPWAQLDVAPGGERVAVLEKFPARRVGVLRRSTGQVDWLDLDHQVASVAWSPDGSRLLLTAYRSDPDEQAIPVNGTVMMLPGTRTGYLIAEPGSPVAPRFVSLPADSEQIGTRADLVWSHDGTLVWAPVAEAPGKKYFDLEGRPSAAPPHEADTYQHAGLSPDGRLLAVDGTGGIVTGVKDVATGRITSLAPVAGQWIEQLEAWAGPDLLIAWACELEGTDGCAVSEFRNRLVLITTDGTTLTPLTGYRPNSQAPGSWTPLITPR